MEQTRRKNNATLVVEDNIVDDDETLDIAVDRWFLLPSPMLCFFGINQSSKQANNNQITKLTK